MDILIGWVELKCTFPEFDPYLFQSLHDPLGLRRRQDRSANQTPGPDDAGGDVFIVQADVEGDAGVIAMSNRINFAVKTAAPEFHWRLLVSIGGWRLGTGDWSLDTCRWSLVVGHRSPFAV